MADQTTSWNLTEKFWIWENPGGGILGCPGDYINAKGDLKGFGGNECLGSTRKWPEFVHIHKVTHKSISIGWMPYWHMLFEHNLWPIVSWPLNYENTEVIPRKPGWKETKWLKKKNKKNKHQRPQSTGETDSTEKLQINEIKLATTTSFRGKKKNPELLQYIT